MLTIKRIFMCSMVMALLLFVSCKQAEEKEKVVYPENEIPVATESDEALMAFMDGLKLYDQGDATKARDNFDKALELDPDFVSAQMYRTFTSNSAKDWGDNRTKLMSMRDKAGEGEAMMLDILEAGMAGDTEKELEMINALVAKYPKSARAMEELAGYYSGMDEIEKAREHWKKAHELDPENLSVISSLGFTYLFTSPKDFGKAQGFMQMLVDKAPESSSARINLGDCYRAQNDLEMALSNYEKAAELDPENDVALSKAGHANTFMGNYEAARENFRKCREVSEYGTGGYNFEAYTYLYEGDYKKALAFLDEGAKMFETMDIPASNKNMAKMGCASDCAMIAMHYGDAEHLKELVAMMKPMSDQLSAEVDNDITTAYQNANMHYWDAMASATEGNYEDAAAKADMIKSVLEDVNDPNKLRPFHRVHAFVNMKSGDHEKALEHLAELDKDNVYDAYWMAKAYEMAGDNEKSMEFYNEIANNNFNSVAYALILSEAKEMIASAD